MHETTTFLLVTLPNIHRFKKQFSLTDLAITFIDVVLTTQPHLKYVASQYLSLMAYFLTLMSYRVVWQHMQGEVGFEFTANLPMKRFCKSVKI